MVTSRCEAVRKLHAWRKDFDRALKRITSIACELDSPWDLGISSVFSRDDAPWSNLYVLIELPSVTVDPSRIPAPPPPPWYQHGVPVMLLRPLPWPDWDSSWGESSLDSVEFLPPRGNWWGHHTSCQLPFYALVYFEMLCFVYLSFSTTSVVSEKFTL